LGFSIRAKNIDTASTLYLWSFEIVRRMGIPARLFGVGQECPTYKRREVIEANLIVHGILLIHRRETDAIMKPMS